MMQTARRWRLVAGGFAVGCCALANVAAGGIASADPVQPSPTLPDPTAQTAPVAVSPAGQPSLVPASSGTLRDYFAEKGVQLEPQTPDGLTELDITLPVPTGWTQVPDPNVPDAFAVIADRGAATLYTPNAQVVVYKLVGEFDPAEAITHGFVDSQQLFAWKATRAALGYYGGFPSSLIEGTYRENDMTLNTSRRHVIATVGPNRYLVSLAVTTAAGRAIGTAPATEAMVNGFRVAPHVADATPEPTAHLPTAGTNTMTAPR